VPICSKPFEAPWLDDPTTPSRRPGSGLATAVAPARVLLAEDNPVNQRVALHILRKQGFDVQVAENGRVAVDAWEREPFDVVLMDVHMPEMDGFAAVAAIRAREQETGRHTPIVALTAEAFVEDRDRCLAAGMDAYLSKPVTASRLIEVINSVLRPPTRAA
jgi:CheY-like chemotaxis protein